jgi:phosphoribosylglycinamide formyltransferase-1
LAVIASGEGTTLQAILDAIDAGKLKASIAVVISNNSHAGALKRAQGAGIPSAHLSSQTHPDPDELDQAILGTLLAEGADWILLAGYLKKLGPRVLQHYRGRIINTHPALLPKFGGRGMYGRRVHEAVLAAGEVETGVSIHLVEAEYDTGVVLAHCRVPVLASDTPGDLAARVKAREREFVVETLNRLLGVSEASSWERRADSVAASWANCPVVSVFRFPRGLGHFVFDVTLADGRAVVVRLGEVENARYFDAAMHWHPILSSIGVPLPAILAAGHHRNHPYFVLERLRGTDLGDVYEGLTSADKRRIAADLVEIQKRVRTLPEGGGYGDAPSYDGPYVSDAWSGVVKASIDRSRTRLAAAGEHLPDADRVEAAADSLAAYFSDVAPRPFLDDATTKNVLVHDGRLSGIVDVDWLCFGDWLLPIGLTRASLLAAGQQPDYANYWLEALEPSAEERRAVRFYTALSCLDFLSERGQRFNRSEPRPFEHDRWERIRQTLQAELSSL